MPETHRALMAGDISLSDVRMLVAARETDPVAFERSEAQLVGAARTHSARDLQRVTAFWRERVARDAA